LIKKTKILPFSLVIFLSSILLIGIISSSSYAYAQQPQQSSNQRLPPSIIAASTTDTTPHALNLKATQQGEDGQPKRVSGFKIDLTNVVTAQINSQVLVFATDSSLQVTGAKIRTVSGQLIDLIPSTTTRTNAFSVAGFPVGVYTLDIITQKGNTKAAYEGVLVISQLPTTVINENTKQVINQEINQKAKNTDNDVKVIFKEKDDDDDDNGDDKGNPYCDLVPDNYNGSCHDRKDGSDDTGLYTCRDGSHVKDWRDCKDAGKHPDEEEEKEEEKDEEGCDEHDDHCDTSQDCDSPDVDCIDDVNVGDDGEDSVTEEEEEEDPVWFENDDGALGDPITDEEEIEELEQAEEESIEEEEEEEWVEEEEDFEEEDEEGGDEEGGDEEGGDEEGGDEEGGDEEGGGN
jgi:hypothetical protein